MISSKFEMLFKIQLRLLGDNKWCLKYLSLIIPFQLISLRLHCIHWGESCHNWIYLFSLVFLLENCLRGHQLLHKWKSSQIWIIKYKVHRGYLNIINRLCNRQVEIKCLFRQIVHKIQLSKPIYLLENFHLQKGKNKIKQASNHQQILYHQRDHLIYHHNNIFHQLELLSTKLPIKNLQI